MFRSDRSTSRRVESGAGSASAFRVESEPGVLLLAPSFALGHQLLAQLPVILFLATWGAALFGGLAHVVLGIGGRALPVWLPFVGCGVALAALLPMLGLRIAHRAHGATSYVFGAGLLRYDEGFVSLEHKTLPLGEVTRVRLRRGWLQRRYGLGTLVITTRASSGQPTRTPVKLLDLPEPERALARVRAAVRDEDAARLARVA